MRRSAAGIREALGSAVLELRRGAATSRSSLSQAIGVAASTGGIYVDLLIEAGYVAESGLDQGPLGRPRRSLALRPEAGWFAGVEFHAARAQAVAVNFAGKSAKEIEIALPLHADAGQVIEIIADQIRYLGEDQGQGKLLAIGVGAPGVIDPDTGTSRDYSYIAGWKKVAVVEELKTRFGVPVALENNLRTIAMAERWFGGGKALNNFACLGLRTGAAVGMFVEGALVCGAGHSAGEIGKWPWPVGDERGGHLQQKLSAPAIYRRVTGLGTDAELPADLRGAFAALRREFRQGAELAQAWQPVVRELAQLMAALQLLLNPSAIFLHGPLTSLGGEFCEVVATIAQELEGGTGATPLCFLPSSLGDEAGALGAAGFAMERWTPAVKNGA